MLLNLTHEDRIKAKKDDEKRLKEMASKKITRKIEVAIKKCKYFKNKYALENGKINHPLGEKYQHLKLHKKYILHCNDWDVIIKVTKVN